jgi:hypothetical protein
VGESEAPTGGGLPILPPRTHCETALQTAASPSNHCPGQVNRERCPHATELEALAGGFAGEPLDDEASEYVFVVRSPGRP